MTVTKKFVSKYKLKTMYLFLYNKHCTQTKILHNVLLKSTGNETLEKVSVTKVS